MLIVSIKVCPIVFKPVENRLQSLTSVCPVSFDCVKVSSAEISGSKADSFGIGAL